MLWLIVAATLPLGAQDNSLTAAEKKAGWTLLFDGKSYRGWLDPARRKPAGDAWLISEGALRTVAHPKIREDLVSAESYGDFELAFDWKIAPGGNSGLKYGIQDFILLDSKYRRNDLPFEQQVAYELAHKPSRRDAVDPKVGSEEYVVGFEYQMIDDSAHADARRGGLYQSGALYSMIAPSKKAAKAPGEWNQGRIVKRGARIEHWLNGVKVLDGTLDDPAIGAMAGKRWKDVPQVKRMLAERPKKECPISLQNHNDAAWFRNLKIRRLP